LKKGQFDTLYYYNPTTGDDFRDHFLTFIEVLADNYAADTPAPVLFILDSAKALVPDAVLDDPDNEQMAQLASMYSKMLPTVQSHLTRTGCSFIYVNQLRKNPGAGKFGDPDYEPCGESLKFTSAMRLRISKEKPKIDGVDHPFVPDKTKVSFTGSTWLKNHMLEEPHSVAEADEVDRYTYSAITSVKNKVFSPQKICWMRILSEEAGSTGTGLDTTFDIFSILAEVGFLEKVRARQIYNLKSVGGMDLSDLIPKTFDYQTFKEHVAKDKRNLFLTLRQRMFDKDFIYTQLGTKDTEVEPVESESEESEEETSAE